MSWRDLFSARATRRTFLSAGALGAAALPLELRAAQQQRRNARVPFEALPPSTADEFRVAKGYAHQVLLGWQDDIGNGRFGCDPDFTAFFAIDLLERSFDLKRAHAGYAPRNASSSEGLLVVNHEWVDPRFLAPGADQHSEVGVSVTRIIREDGRWNVVKDRSLNRSYDARTEFLLTGPAAAIDGGPRVVGTLANCSGGVTPWGTVLSCEENFQDYLGVAEGLNWDPKIYGRRHYGWVVEIDPYDPNATPRKHTAMGRMRHENVGLRVAGDGSVAAYMGDDKRDSCVYKFVADRKLSNDRGANMHLLESGKLYAADFANGRWILLDASMEALSDARKAALDAGATPVDRPEDLEVDPRDGSVLIAMTNNALHGNFYGHIVRLTERNGDIGSMDFDWSVFATGGPQSGFSCPDNLHFGDDGSLWMCTDVADESVGRGIYTFLGNNSLFLVKDGALHRFAVGPVQCELTGPSWTPDCSTMFISAQHPGGHSAELETKGPSSHWPDGRNATPRGAVVAITGF